MFLVNSCLGLFSANDFHRLPLFRSYGAILPSSLTIVISLTLVYSTWPPVSVLGTGTYSMSLEAFLGSLESECFDSVESSPSRFSLIDVTDFLMHQPLRLDLNPFTGHSYLSPSLHQSYKQYRNLNLLSIDYAFQPRLRSWLTQGRRTLPWKPWSIGGKDSHLPYVTHTGILTSKRSSSPLDLPSSPLERSPTIYITINPQFRYYV